MLAPSKPLTLADEILNALPRLTAANPQGATIAVITKDLAASVPHVRTAARSLNVDGRAVLMRRFDSSEQFLVPGQLVTRSTEPLGLRCCIQCSSFFKIKRWRTPASYYEYQYSPSRTCSQKCAGIVAARTRSGERVISQEKKDRCVSLRLQHNLSAPEIARRVGISNHSAYRLLEGFPAWRPGKRKPIRGSEWTRERDDIVRELYPASERPQIEAALPTHTWTGIERRASFLKVRRRKGILLRSAEHRVHPIVAQLLRHREQNGLSRVVIAKRAGIHHGMILNYEAGKTKPDFLSFVKWAEALGFEVTLTLRSDAGEMRTMRKAA